ncbi:diacylglycerol/lipid kinase family protein [Raoultibacter phocaeensis]|uniref:diacylglycerol/lipid kinase family protein n=1 Tax=Raoultibacter phocaeensis TaxID=2479841 RepID=UPI0011194E48|nr:diacylglycerol kinase family protein [Raoultibacter phocaeensis]
MTYLGKTLVVANPVAQNGNGAAAAERAGEHLRRLLPEGSFELAMTEEPLHATRIAAQSGAFDTVVALGGDGIVHEVVNGLMEIDEAVRPAFGLLPLGSGNDYARTLGMSFDLETSIRQLVAASPVALDLGLCNGEYFAETLSFGLDAAIALDTVERRKRTGKTGTPLFLASGIDMLLHNITEHRFSAQIDGGEPFESSMLLFAVQIGPTYGGGFTICPDASARDGLLDLCIAHPPLGIPKAVLIFLLAKNAHHTRFKQLEFRRAASLSIRFDEAPPAQIDGEPIPASSFDVSVVPRALNVLVP